MRMRTVGKWLAAGGLALALALAPGIASAARKWKLTAKSDYGLIAVQLAPDRGLFMAGGYYELEFMAYNPGARRFQSTAFTGSAYVRASPYLPYERFRLRNAKPGFYALQAVRISAWGTCFNAGTYYFEVKPGQTSYVGLYDIHRDHAALLEAVNARLLPGAARSNEWFYLFDTPRPALTLPGDDPQGLADLKAWMRAEQPGVEGEPVAADMIPTTFDVGAERGLMHLYTCGVWGNGQPAARPLKPLKLEGG